MIVLMMIIVVVVVVYDLQRERLRSIVMSMSVCLSARISPEPHARCLQIFVHVAYVRGSGVLQHVDDRQCTARAKCNLRLPCSNPL